jgi:hypothetical protein
VHVSSRILLGAALAVGATRLHGQSAATDEAAIRAARARSNRAIVAHNLDSAAALWSPDYVGVSSTNSRAIGRDAERALLAQLIAARPDVVYVRTPLSVSVNVAWGHAGESGRWSGKWSGADGVTRVGGTYFAKWTKASGTWTIVAETFVQTSCSGTHYCDAPPRVP